MVQRSVSILDFSGKELRFSFSEIETGCLLQNYMSDDSSLVIIPDRINGKPVTQIGEKCFFLHDEIENIYIPGTVIEIGEQAFAMCKMLREIIIPSSVKTIGPAAFRDDKSLRRIILPDSLEELPPSIFSYCRFGTDTEIQLPHSLKRIGACAFYSSYGYDGCTIIIPDSVEYIGDSAFYSGPKFTTKLPYNRKWVDTWPYGEEVIVDGEKGIVVDYKSVAAPSKFHVMELISIEVLFSSNRTTKYLYPISFKDSVRFSDTYWQNKAEKEVDQIKDDDRSKILLLWKQGLL